MSDTESVPGRSTPADGSVDSRLAEAAGLGALSAAVGGVATLPIGLAPAGALIAGVNGCVCGWMGIYDLGSRKGWWAWLRDSTWALPTTGAGLLMMALQRLRSDADYRPDLSRRQNRITYGGGWRARRGFATSIGPVIVNAFDRQKLPEDDPRMARRRLLVTRHEQEHVEQARRWGPLFPALYSGWLIGGVARALWWKAKGDPSRLRDLVMTSSYFLNPFEKAAYRKDEYWPPAGVLNHRVR